MVANSRSARLLPAAPARAIELLGQSPAVVRSQELVRRAAALDSNVLLVAEPGVDVESVARDLHLRSRAATAPWVVADCGCEGPELELKLFGLVEPSAINLESLAAASLVATARGGTLFLKDVAELPAGIQARLARLVRDGEARIEGQPTSMPLRLVTAASPSIDADVHRHRFRPDLYRRLAATRIDLPPLRDRSADVPAIIERMLVEAAAANRSLPRSFTQAALALFAALTWPGNLAELRGAVERVLTQTTAAVIQVEAALPALRLERSLTPFIPVGNLREARMRFERDYIAAVLQHHSWRMADAAQTLGIQRPNLYRKARQLGIPVARAIIE